MYKKTIKPILDKLYKNTKENTYKTVTSTMSAFCSKNPDIKSINNHKLIIARIMNTKSKKPTKLKQLFIFGSIYKELNKKKAKEAILKEYKTLNKDLYKQLKKNKPRSFKDKICKDTTLQSLRDILDYDDLDQKNILFSIYVSMDYTPRLELSDLIYVTSHKPSKDKYKNKNYIYFNNNNKCFIVLNDYKTAETYGTWNIPVDGKLKIQLSKYLKEYKSNNEHVFLNRVKKPFPRNKFSEFFQSCFKKKLKRKITSTCLRKIKENHVYHHNTSMLNMSVAEKEKYLIKYFRHNKKTAENWYKFVRTNKVSKKKGVWNSQQPQDDEYYQDTYTKPQKSKVNVNTFLGDLHHIMVKNKVSKDTLKLITSQLS